MGDSEGEWSHGPQNAIATNDLSGKFARHQFLPKAATGAERHYQNTKHGGALTNCMAEAVNKFIS